MIERNDDEPAAADGLPDLNDADERVGEAVEAYLSLAEKGTAPGIEEFAARYPELQDDVQSALEGLELVHGLLGLGSAQGSGPGRGRAWLTASKRGGGSPAIAWCVSWGAAAWGRCTRRFTWDLSVPWRSRCWGPTPRPTHRLAGGS